MTHAPGATSDNDEKARKPARGATALLVLACTSYAAYVTNSLAVRQFFEELARLFDKFVL